MTLDQLFLTVLNMSITATIVLAFVLLARFLLKKAPRIFSYALWAIVLFRLICPVSFSSPINLISLLHRVDGSPAPAAASGQIQYIPPDIAMAQRPEIRLGVGALSQAVNESLPAATPAASANPLQIIIFIASLIWVLGIALLLFYSVISYLLLQKKIAAAVLVPETVYGNVYETDRIPSPFVCGFFRPRIYLPLGLGEKQREYVLLHESAHIRRRDYLIKPISFLALTLHWFNPFMWLAFVLMTKDMEMSCDERVLKDLAKAGRQSQADYSDALLSLAARRFLPSGSPLAFGETSVKERIRHILTYRKPAVWLAALGLVICLLFTAGCLANPPAAGGTSVSGTAQDDGLDIAGREAAELARQLYAGKTLYIGNASAVGGLLAALPAPEGVIAGIMSLQTSEEPYGLTKHYQLINDQWIPEEAPFSRNACMLFATIDNMGELSFLGHWTNSLLSSLGFGYSYTREEIEELLGFDPRERAGSEEDLAALWLTVCEKIPLEPVAEPPSITSQGFAAALEKSGASSAPWEEEDLRAENFVEITPPGLSGLQIFKNSKTYASYIYRDGGIYPFSGYFGGFGVTSVQPVSGEKGIRGLLYASSWGSGPHRSEIGFFDLTTMTDQPRVVDYTNENNDMVILALDGELSGFYGVYRGEMTAGASWEAAEYLGSLTIRDNTFIWYAREAALAMGVAPDLTAGAGGPQEIGVISSYFADPHEPQENLSETVDLNGDRFMENIQLIDLRHNGGDGGYALGITQYWEGREGEPLPLPEAYDPELGFPFTTTWDGAYLVIYAADSPIASISAERLAELYRQKGLEEEWKRIKDRPAASAADAVSGFTVLYPEEGGNPVLIAKSYISGLLAHADCLGYGLTHLRLLEDNTWQVSYSFVYDE